ncbi:membrane-bound acyltransferase YfiQ involved in biofilm formation [Bacillus ectoiniformans]|uniref:acyltransferase family protein n=1 Tax=Bacillus ectoiniformans TaxID=1494429 RepID=UPI00195BD8AA|nr:acyltransferase family protein [Bacillus ectoiniformans]MBM7649319.1 membrane-bound acyltransferase YfiQ involved in biofilm formation [Bacillus ectoiniformans]
MKKQVNEIYWIRAIACLSVVFIHLLTLMLVNNPELPEKTAAIVQSAQLMLLFATPMFILISEVLLAHAYPDQLPKGFFQKRIKYIFLPYVFISFLYAAYAQFTLGFTMEGFLTQSAKHLFLVSWHGYFILIIFQFYLLHAFFIRFMKQASVWFTLAVTASVQITYTYVFLYTPAPDSEMLQVFWSSYSRLLFPGWLFYFTAAWHLGRNINATRFFIKKHVKAIGAICASSALVMVYMFLSGEFSAMTSRRIDVIFYTVSLFMLLFYWMTKMKKIPAPVMLISRYSFAIYLLHPMMQNIMHSWFVPMRLSMYIPLMFVLNTAACILAAWLLQKIPFGKFIIGNIPAASRKKAKSISARQRSQVNQSLSQ